MTAPQLPSTSCQCQHWCPNSVTIEADSHIFNLDNLFCMTCIFLTSHTAQLKNLVVPVEILFQGFSWDDNPIYVNFPNSSLSRTPIELCGRKRWSWRVVDCHPPPVFQAIQITGSLKHHWKVLGSPFQKQLRWIGSFPSLDRFQGNLRETAIILLAAFSQTIPVFS